MVARYSPSLAKNMIRRSLRGILDPHPSKQELKQLWQYFNARCAYCDCQVGVQEKDHQIDHLNPNGGNHLSNRVLACSNCNEKEKRDSAWEAFLRTKAQSEEDFHVRSDRILAWTRRTKVEPKITSDEWRAVDLEIAAVIEAYDKAMQRIRKIRNDEDSVQP